MNDVEIRVLIESILKEANESISLRYKPPVVAGSCHSIDLENRRFLGSISVWSSGVVDWHIFDIAASAEAFLGTSKGKDINEVREILYKNLKMAGFQMSSRL